ncbi:PepSY domain-containing protein [Pseudomonas sp. Q1-7]|uniref:PepSY domain-containing protein n=1 Tax=Pseudomonas sp. Q1-7 TaxID=3020843 RepID=UPI00230015D8|nr:PepSY domain-containing protein [Pseudomonas sp. Q1-7]
MKRYLYLWHRWLGIGLCLLMALWFVSGLVMLYVGYPKLTPREHLARLPVLSAEGCCVNLAEALAASGRSEAPTAIRLTSLAGQPHYLLAYAQGPGVAVQARSGRAVTVVDEAFALASAGQFSPAPARYLDRVDEDAWSHSRSLDADRPLLRVQLDGDEGRLLYLSGQTGAVVRDATAHERAWNWLGAWLHWLYPLRGGALDGAWSPLLIGLSLAATLMTLLGLVVGVLRWRFSKPYRSGSRSPYRGVARWHHLGGLLFGGLALAWIFSGLLSMNPCRLFDHPRPLSLAAWQGGDLQPDAFPLEAGAALAQLRRVGFQARELEWRMLAGEGYLVARDGAGNLRVLQGDGRVRIGLEEQRLWRTLAASWPAELVGIERLEAHDSYYYGRAEQSMSGHLDRPLPILRVHLEDPARTWLHIDPRSGVVLERLDERQRVYRWVFKLLHSWDWPPLLAQGALRDGLMIAGSLGGLLICLSGVVLGWRRLGGGRKTARPRRG